MRPYCRRCFADLRLECSHVEADILSTVFQCHEACIAVYSSMKNRKLSHWVFISVVSMFICLIIYSLTGHYGSVQIIIASFLKTVYVQITPMYSIL